ncbi:carboxypeptidase regulatory-like domain-containing protein [Candidatus Woesearchaeota archaeon]|nr:carboxypeptidase regulatory-like domain-containing protein [Candidatus Woesearchaeota archaeon]
MSLNKINAKLTILLGLSLLLMPFANALTVNDFFQNFYGLVENQYAFYTIMFLVIFIFLFSIFFALSKNIPFFKASGGSVGPAGQIFALSLSAIATLSLFSYMQGRGGAGYASGFFTNRIGSWGWILLALLILAVVFFALRKKGKGILGEGDFDANLKKLTALLWVISFILVMYGSISKNRTITTIGAVLFVIALILTALTGGFKFGEDKEKEPTPPPVPPEPSDGYGIIYGVVTDINDTNEKVPFARIQCSGTGGMFSSDANGTYYIQIPAGTYQLQATKEGYEQYNSQPITVQSKDRLIHNIKMTPIGGVKGLVEGRIVYKNDMNKGVDRAIVKLLTQGPDHYYILPIDPQTSDANGKFIFKDLTLPKTKVVVYAEKEGKPNTHTMGGRPAEPFDLDQTHPERKDVLVVLDVPLPPTQMGYIEGRVIVSELAEEFPQKGINGAIVWAESSGGKVGNEATSIWGGSEYENENDGYFKIENVPLNTKNIIVHAKFRDVIGNHMDEKGYPQEKIELKEIKIRVRVPLRMQPVQTGKIKGKIADVTNNDRPIPDSEVSIATEEGQYPTNTQLRRLTNGEFEFEVPHGNYFVYGKANGYVNINGNSEIGKHTDQPGGNPPHVITINDTNPNQMDVVVPLKPRGTPPGPTELPNIKVELDSQTIQKLTAGDKYDHLIFKIKNDGGKARIRLFVNLYKYVGSYITDQAGNIDYGRLDASRQFKEINAGQWRLNIKRLVGGDFIDVRADNSKRLMELTMAKGTMVQIEFEIPKNAQGIYHIQLTAAALRPGNKEYYTEEFGHDTKWYIVDVIKKGIEKEIKEVKKKTAEAKKAAEKSIRSGEAKTSVKWANEKMLDELKLLIDNIDNKIKIIGEMNEEEYNRILKEPKFKINYDSIKKIYKARSAGNASLFRGYEQYTYEKVFKIAEIISDFLDKRIDPWHKHPR